MNNEFLRIEEAVSLLNEHGYPIKKPSIYYLINAGKFATHRKFGSCFLFKKEDLLEWASQRGKVEMNIELVNASKKTK